MIRFIFILQTWGVKKGEDHEDDEERKIKEAEYLRLSNMVKE